MDKKSGIKIEETINMSMETTFSGPTRMGYETPPKGISLTGYIVRRMQKTVLLRGIDSLLPANSKEALAKFGIYAIAAATSWGPALYQPRFDSPGTEITEEDPDTGAKITVRQLPRSPHYSFSYTVSLPGGAVIRGNEMITGTTVGFRGLGMPAPSSYEFVSADGSYMAEAAGIINSELAPRIGRWKIRGYGELQLSDNQGAEGKVKVNRKGHISGVINQSSLTPYSFSYQIS